MKRAIVPFVMIVLLVPLFAYSSSDGGIVLQIGSKTAFVDGKQVELESPPVIVNSRTMVPIRFISESLGARVNWIGETKTITIDVPKQEIIEGEGVFEGKLRDSFENAKVSIDVYCSEDADFRMVDMFIDKVSIPESTIRILTKRPEFIYGDNIKSSGIVIKHDTQIQNNTFFCIIDDNELLYGGSVLTGLSIYSTDTGLVNDLVERFDTAWESSPIISDIQDDKQDNITPPPGFIEIPPNPKFGIDKPFYVSKYEMKIKGESDGNKGYDSSYIAESRADGTPWIGLTMSEAKQACEALGEGYSLITNSEWMAIAQNIELCEKNWSDGKTHKTDQTEAMLNVGNVCRYGNRGTSARIAEGKGMEYFGEGVLEASSNDSLGCFGYKSYDAGIFGFVEKPELNDSGWNLFRRTHYLPNDSVIWDFSGNVWEWCDWNIELSKDRARIDAHFDENYLEINACNTFSDKMKAIDFQSYNTGITDISKYTGDNYYPDGDDIYGIKADKYTNLNRLGRFHPTSRDYSAGIAMRGSSCMHGDSTAGIYSLAMGYGSISKEIKCKVGFRCVWRPTE